jgi:hypothetical protein
MVSHPLEIGNDVNCGCDVAEIARHRRLRSDNAKGVLFSCPALLVDRPIGRDDLLRHPDVLPDE